MKKCWDRLFGLKDYDKWSFRVSVGDGFITIDCPGNACGIHPDHNAGLRIEKDEGYEFTCHNVDSPAQQLTLLAGLAALHDKARKEIKY